MTTTRISSYKVANVEELQRAVNQIRKDIEPARHPSEIYLLNDLHLVLEEALLSDGSKVYNVGLIVGAAK